MVQLLLTSPLPVDEHEAIFRSMARFMYDPGEQANRMKFESSFSIMLLTLSTDWIYVVITCSSGLLCRCSPRTSCWNAAD